MLDEQFFTQDGQPTDYLQQLYDEQASLSQTKFKFMEDGTNSPLNDIFFLSNSLNDNKLEEVLSGDFVMNEFNPEAIKTHLNHLSSAKNLIIFVGDNEYKFQKGLQKQ